MATPFSFTSASILLFLIVLLSAEVLGEAPWPYHTFTTMPDIRPPKMNVKKSGAPTEPGYFFVGPRGNEEEGTAPLIYDQDGELVYQGPHGVIANFRIQKIYGRDMLTFWSGDMLPIGHGYGTFHVLDETYEEVYTVRLTGNFVTAYNDERESYIDLHETTVTEDSTLLVTAYNVTQADLTEIGGKKDAWVLEAQFYEMDIATNEILYSWAAFDHAGWDFPISKQPIYEKSVTQDEPYDAYHINSVEKAKEGYIISMRHIWGGFYVNWDGTMRWFIDGADGGDFQQGEGTDYSWQHDIRVFDETPEGMTLSLFNNANTPKSQIEPASGVSIYVDLVNMKLTNKRRLVDPEEYIHSVSQGNYQQLNNSDHVIVYYGSITVIKEFDGEGNTVMTARFGPDDTYAGYRGFKCEWVGTPYWDPDIVIIPARNGQAQLSMSWNGATEYDNWAIYGGQARDPIGSSLHSVVERTGFETTTNIDTKDVNYIQIVARKGEEVLRSSEIYTV